MNKAYNLPIIGNVQTLKQWNELDPVDQAEIDRNNAIEKVQGSRNRFIDNPHAVKDLDITVTR